MTERLCHQVPPPLACEAVVTEVRPEGVVLDRTPFYPQGGGQPSDTGTMGSWKVVKVRADGDAVVHALEPASPLPAVGEKVACAVDAEKRRLHARLHSAGHVMDMAITAVGLGWKPAKGYHFPQGPYVEYSGSLDGQDPTKLKTDLEAACASILAAGTETSVRTLPWEEARRICPEFPPGVPEGAEVRMVGWGQAAMPCGGTHVGSLSEIGAVTVRKIKREGAFVRVGYAVP